MTNIPYLDNLLNSEDATGSIIELDDFIAELCEYGENFDEVTEQQKTFYLIQNLEREVNNGGFKQYFSNSSGDNAHETISSLSTIGAFKTAEILKKAIAQFPNENVPKDRDERVRIIQQIENSADEVWDELTETFFRYEDDLTSLNLEYVKANKEHF